MKNSQNRRVRNMSQRGKNMCKYLYFLQSNEIIYKIQKLFAWSIVIGTSFVFGNTLCIQCWIKTMPGWMYTKVLPCSELVQNSRGNICEWIRQQRRKQNDYTDGVVKFTGKYKRYPGSWQNGTSSMEVQPEQLFIEIIITVIINIKE